MSIPASFRTYPRRNSLGSRAQTGQMFLSDFCQVSAAPVVLDDQSDRKRKGSTVFVSTFVLTPSMDASTFKRTGPLASRARYFCWMLSRPRSLIRSISQARCRWFDGEGGCTLGRLASPGTLQQAKGNSRRLPTSLGDLFQQSRPQTPTQGHGNADAQSRQVRPGCNSPGAG